MLQEVQVETQETRPISMASIRLLGWIKAPKNGPH